MNRLDPRDFSVDAQGAFVRVRLQVRGLAKFGDARWGKWLQAFKERPNDFGNKSTQKRWIAILQSASNVFDQFAGQGSQAVARTFLFLHHADLRDIVERDYKELTLKLMPNHAWKSAVVLAGSILEAILYDQLTADSARTTAATSTV